MVQTTMILVFFLHYIQFDKLHKITNKLIYDINMNNNCINIKTHTNTYNNNN